MRVRRIGRAWVLPLVLPLVLPTFLYSCQSHLWVRGESHTNRSPAQAMPELTNFSTLSCAQILSHFLKFNPEAMVQKIIEGSSLLVTREETAAVVSAVTLSILAQKPGKRFTRRSVDRMLWDAYTLAHPVLAEFNPDTATRIEELLLRSTEIELARRPLIEALKARKLYRGGWTSLPEKFQSTVARRAGTAFLFFLSALESYSMGALPSYIPRLRFTPSERELRELAEIIVTGGSEAGRAWVTEKYKLRSQIDFVYPRLVAIYNSVALGSLMINSFGEILSQSAESNEKNAKASELVTKMLDSDPQVQDGQTLVIEGVLDNLEKLQLAAGLSFDREQERKKLVSLMAGGPKSQKQPTLDELPPSKEQH